MPPINPTNPTNPISSLNQASSAPQIIPSMPTGMPAPKPKTGGGGRAIVRTFIILIVVGGIGFAGYKMFLEPKVVGNTPSGSDGLVTTAGVGVGTSATPDVTNPSTTGMSSEQIGNDFLTTLLSVKDIRIESELFTSTAFTALQDFSRPLLPDNNPGRPNPFAPLGSDTTTISTQISTTNVSRILTTTATLNGTLTISDDSTTRWFEYGTTTALGTSTTKKIQTTPGTFADTVTGLLPNTLYYVKALATYGGQTIAGNVISFKTSEAVR